MEKMKALQIITEFVRRSSVLHNRVPGDAILDFGGLVGHHASNVVCWVTHVA
jgi:hypothetical protein